MIDELLEKLAPHHCCGCDLIGTLLCDNCKNNIVDEKEMTCIVCNRPTFVMNLCQDCRVPYERAWFVGFRYGLLQRLIGLYKFQRTRVAYRSLGDLLLETLPELPSDTVIVPVPTVSSHIRERGYDHMALICRFIARQRGLDYKRALIRKTNTKQRQASLKTRERQAKDNFAVNGEIDRNRPYLIVDDVYTTGATVKYAAKALVDAGAKHVWVAVIARQTLD